jgi:hypothetical protein
MNKEKLAKAILELEEKYNLITEAYNTDVLLDENETLKLKCKLQDILDELKEVFYES